MPALHLHCEADPNQEDQEWKPEDDGKCTDITDSTPVKNDAGEHRRESDDGKHLNSKPRPILPPRDAPLE